MNEFTQLLQQGNAWLFIPSAILLGALHGLEPGHSKTMMAAFIVAIRGTVGQAVLLGITATISHTLIVWTIGLGGMYLWRGVDLEGLEPYFQIASGIVIIGVAGWMSWRVWRDRKPSGRARAHRHGFGHSHGHGHGHDHGHGHGHGHDHGHRHDHGHAHGRAHTPVHAHVERQGVDLASDEYQDAHQRAHANEIQRRFSGRQVTNGQIALFGLTGGLVPCPAAITVLMLCLQLKAYTVGATLVLCFSIGLALTLVTVGVVAALSIRHLSRRSTWFSGLAARAPYFSSLLMVAVGCYVAMHGLLGLASA